MFPIGRTASLLTPIRESPKSGGPVVKKISASLGTCDGRFHLLNRGITLSVKKAEFDNQVNHLSDFHPRRGTLRDYRWRPYGLCYQEHNLGFRKAGREEALGNQYVHVEVLSKIENDLADIAEAKEDINSPAEVLDARILSRRFQVVPPTPWAKTIANP